MAVGEEPQTQYPLAQSEEEMRRLAVQALALHSQPTRQLFAQAGLKEGMRVLDVGCGAGDVAFLAAEFVGSSGSILGVDTSPRALDTARLRADRAGLGNIAFLEADLQTYVNADAFDALVGRSVLMYLKNPAAALRSLLRSVRNGGVVAFREPLIGEPILEASTKSTLVDEFNAWYMASAAPAAAAAGVDVQLGLRLHQVFRDAGLPAPEMWLHAPIGSEPDWPGWEYIGHQVQMMASRASGLPSVLEPATIGARMRDEILSQGGALRIQRGVQAWALKTGSPS